MQDVFELQRNLNNAFAYDLVPSPSVIIAALKAARRVNDYPTAVRVFEGMIALVAEPRTRMMWLTVLYCRHQSESRERRPIPGIPQGAPADPGRDGCGAEGELVPGEHGR